MANYRWTGATSGVWKLAGNWVNADTGAAVAKYPGETGSTYDVAIFDTPLGSGQSPASVSSLTEDLSGIIVGPEYDGALGSGSAYIEVNIGTGSDPNRGIIIEGTSASGIYLKGASDEGLCDVAVLAGEVYFDGECNSNIRLLKGTCEFAATAVFPAGGLLVLGYQAAPTSDLTVELKAGCTMPGNVYMYGGIVTLKADHTSKTWTMSNGTLTLYDTIGTLVQTGGTVNWVNGDLTTYYGFAGRINGGVSTNVRSNEYAVCGATATIDLDGCANNIIFVHGIDYLGGTLQFPVGCRVNYS